MLILTTTISLKMVIAIFSKSFAAQCQGSRAEHEENEWDVHIVDFDQTEVALLFT